jgi:hypothetical protein
MIDLNEYIESLPHWHKHKQGHVVKIFKYKDGEFYGKFWNYASGDFIEQTAGDRYHMHCLESGELTEIPADELAKYLLLDKAP